MRRDGAEAVAEVTSTGRSFHMRRQRKGRHDVTVGSLTVTAGTSRSSDEEDRSLCRDGMSAIGVNCRMVLRGIAMESR